MKKRKSISSIMIFALIFMISVGYMVYAREGIVKTNEPVNQPINKSNATVQNIDNKNQIQDSEKAIGVSNTQDIDINSQVQNEVDTNSMDISKDILDDIKVSDGKNYNRNLNNYKKALLRLDIPKEYRNQLEKLIKKGRKMPGMLALYNFLYDNYGTISELEGMVGKLESGKGLADIIKEYNDTHPEYVPGKFDNTYLENLMKSMSIDDILIADRISQKGLAKFEDLINKRKSGMSWKDINASLGVINTSSQLPRMQLTHAQVNKCMQDNAVSEKDAVDTLVLTWKTGKDYKTVSSELKNGKKKEDIMAETYNEKYN